MPRERMTSTYNLPVRFRESMGAYGGLCVWVEMHEHRSERWNQERNVWEVIGDVWYQPRVYLGGASMPEEGTHRECPLYEAYMREPEFEYFHPRQNDLGEFTHRLNAWLMTQEAKDAVRISEQA